MRIISCLTAAGWLGLVQRQCKDICKDGLKKMSCSFVNTSCALCCISPQTVTFTALSHVSVTLVAGCRVKLLPGSSWIHSCRLLLPPYSPLPLHLHWPSQALRCSSYTFSLTHRLCASGCQPTFFRLCWHRWTIAVDYSVTPFSTS